PGVGVDRPLQLRIPRARRVAGVLERTQQNELRVEALRYLDGSLYGLRRGRRSVCAYGNCREHGGASIPCWPRHVHHRIAPPRAQRERGLSTRNCALFGEPAAPLVLTGVAVSR